MLQLLLNTMYLDYDLDTKMNEFKHIKWFQLNFGTLNTTVQELEMILSQKYLT